MTEDLKADAFPLIDLTGQVAIVTGGGRGIGRAIALALAGAGMTVAIVARTAEQVEETATLIEDAGGRSLAIPADVTDRDVVEAMVAEVEARLGPVDLLVNNAGVAGPCGPVWENDPGEWWRCLDVNLRGPFLCSRAVVPGMIDRGRGRIITVASGAGLGPRPYVSAYAVSKCAIIRFVETLAAETKEHGIRAFSIGPGLVRTEMTEGVADSPEDELWLDGWFRERFAAGDDRPPQQAAELVLRLASGQADALTGCFIGVYHDLDEMLAAAEEVREGELYTLRLRT